MRQFYYTSIWQPFATYWNEVFSYIPSISNLIIIISPKLVFRLLMKKKLTQNLRNRAIINLIGFQQF